MSRSLYVTSTITTLFIYLYLNCFWQHMNCAKLDFITRSLNKRNLVEVENPEQVINVLDSLSQSIANSDYDLYKNQKRGIDLGLSRGFSGNQAAKHLMGMSAASFANGPGRKR